eukprot:3593608-Amphidinium_carterae.1
MTNEQQAPKTLPPKNKSNRASTARDHVKATRLDGTFHGETIGTDLAWSSYTKEGKAVNRRLC